MKETENTYVIYNTDTMEQVKAMKLSDTEFSRLSVRPPLWVYIVFISIILISFISIVLYNSIGNKEHEEEMTNLIEEMIISERNKDLHCLIGEYILLDKTVVPHDTVVYEFIKQAGIWYPDIVMAQYVIESAHGKSALSENASNFFGMRKVRNRITVQELDKDYNGYGVYRNWQLSVLDRELWDLHVFDSVPTRNDYLKQIGYIYAEDKDYISKITAEAKRWKKRDMEKSLNN